MWHFQLGTSLGHRHTCISLLTLCGAGLKRSLGSSRLSCPGDPAACRRCGKGPPGYRYLPVSHFPLFPSTLLPSFSLYGHKFPSAFLPLSHSICFLSHTLCPPPQSSVLSPTFNFSSHSLTSCISLHNLLLNLVYFLSLTLSFSPHQFSFFLPYIPFLSHILFFLSFTFLSHSISFLFLLTPHTYIPLLHS